MVRALLSKSLIQFSVYGWACVPFLLFDLRPNCSGGSEENGDLLQKFPCTHCHTQCPQPCGSSLLTHDSTRDAWTLTGKPGPVSYGLTAPFSWVLVSLPSNSLFPQDCVSSGSSMVGLMATSAKKAYGTPRSAAPRDPAPVAGHC